MPNTKDPNKLFEDGFAIISLAAYKLRKNGQHQEAYDNLGHVINLLIQDRQQLRNTANIKV